MGTITAAKGQGMDMTTIWVTWDRIGFHKYPHAPEQVGFLRSTHRHKFKFRAEVQVFHDDRDIEFFMLQEDLMNNVWQEDNTDFDYKSCEMLARDVVNYIIQQYPGCSVKVDCSEDGENGATVNYAPLGKEKI